MTDSPVNSPRSSPCNEMMEEDDYMTETVAQKHRGGKKVGGLDLDDVEHNIRKVQQEREDFKLSLSSIRNQSQSHSRKIHDLQAQFDEARVRIDKLLSRKSRSRSDFIGVMPLSPKSRSSVSTVEASADSSSHKVELNINPKVQQPTFQAVTLTVKVDEDDEN